MRIITLLARHGTIAYPDSIEAIDAIFSRQMPDIAHDLVVIDNALPPSHHESLGFGRTLLGSANTCWEFSAWQRGISSLRERLDQYDFVHLATSAFRTLYTRYLDRFDWRMLNKVRGRAAAVGHIDYYNEPVTVGGRSLRSWLRSSFIFVPPVELRLLGSLVSIDNRDSLFSGDAERPFLGDAPLSLNYQRYILAWLTGAGTGQGLEWHSRFDLNRDTLSYFEAKTMAILNEQIMSSRLRAQGCALVDATWLASRQARLAYGEPLGAIPDWRRQIIERDVDPAPTSLINPGTAGQSLRDRE